MLISQEYRDQQRQMHCNPHYGVISQAYAPNVLGVMQHYNCRALLDYGAGKGRLGQALFGHGYRGDYHAYDPAIDDWADDPEPCEMVACIDVLEHIEPDMLDAVLDDLQRVTQRVGIFTVHCGPAQKTLPDGRNAHLIQQPQEWWTEKLAQRFTIVQQGASKHDDKVVGALFVVEPLP